MPAEQKTRYELLSDIFFTIDLDSKRTPSSSSVLSYSGTWNHWRIKDVVKTEKSSNSNTKFFKNKSSSNNNNSNNNNNTNNNNNSNSNSSKIGQHITAIGSLIESVEHDMWVQREVVDKKILKGVKELRKRD